MSKARDITVRRMVLAAIFAAAVTVTTAFVLHIPLPTGGYIHVGDALIYLCACLMPLPWAMAAGAVGGALADLLTAPMWTVATFLIKAVICLPFTGKSDRILCPRNIVAAILAGLASPALYALANVLFTGTWAAFLPQFIGTLVQAVGSGAVFLALGWGFDQAGLKNRLSL